jgi:hypothetical protein
MFLQGHDMIWLMFLQGQLGDLIYVPTGHEIMFLQGALDNFSRVFLQGYSMISLMFLQDHNMISFMFLQATR